MSHAPGKRIPPIIDTPGALAHLAENLLRQARIAVDTESNSLHAYREQVCLIQISTPSDDYLIDPLALDDLSPVGALFKEPRVEKVFHAAEYDIMCLRRDFDFEFASLFDTQVAVRILGREQVGLASILKDQFGVKMNKRYQRADWGRRPLDPAMAHYARMDTRYLLPLRQRLYAELERAGRLEEAQEAFDEVLAVGPHVSTFDPNGFWRIHGVYNLPPHQQAILRELYLHRERLAEQRNSPPFKIMTDETLLHLARRQPTRLRDLHNLPGLNNGLAQRHGRSLLRCVQRGLVAGEPSPPPRHQRPADAVLARYDALRAWRKQRARKRGVESDIIVSKDVLWTLAKVAPRTPEQLAAIESLGPWKRKTYGAEILQVLSQVDGNG